MTDTPVFIPPVTRAYRYLEGKFPGLVEREDPPDGYDPTTTQLILVKSGGGSGVREHQLLDARLSFEVQAPDAAEAEALAFRVDEALRAWQWEEPGVYHLSHHGVPAWDPHPDTRTPAYTWSVEYSFKNTR